MLGNLKGWLISAGIVAMTVVIFFLQGTAPSVTPSTGKLRAGLQPAAMKTDPLTLAASLPGDLNLRPGANDCDGGELYRQAIADYQENHRKYEDAYRSHISQAATDKPAAIEAVIKAADCSRATLFSKNPSEIVNYHNILEPIEALHDVGMTANRIGLYYVAKKQYKEAAPYLRGAYVLGQRMYNERLRFMEFTDGTDLMTSAATALARQADEQNDKATGDRLRAFVDDVSTYQSGTGQNLWKAIAGIGMGEGREGSLPYAGDMFELAKSSKEPMWRTEAVLKLGRMKYMAEATAADQHGAERLLKSMGDQTDLPAPVKTAVIAARDLTVENFRKIGGGT